MGCKCDLWLRVPKKGIPCDPKSCRNSSTIAYWIAMIRFHAGTRSFILSPQRIPGTVRYPTPQVAFVSHFPSDSSWTHPRGGGPLRVLEGLSQAPNRVTKPHMGFKLYALRSSAMCLEVCRCHSFLLGPRRHILVEYKVEEESVIAELAAGQL